MSEGFIYIIAIAVVLLGVVGSVKDSLKSNTIEDGSSRLIYYVSTLISFAIIIFNLDIFYELVLSFINDILAIQRFIPLFKIVFLALGYMVIHFVIYSILNFVTKPIIKLCSNKINNNKVLLTLVSGFFGMFKGIIFLFLICFCLMAFNKTIGRNNPITLNGILEENQENNKNIIAGQDFDAILNNENVTIYYNGVTLDEGIKSNDEINEKAIRLTKRDTKSLDKAKSIYTWIGENIKYDHDKAEKALNNEKIKNSGAITAWEERQGICFDYACLYVAMAREAGLQVRLVTGMASDGETYGPHAWNEVFIPEENKWINIDPTFYNAGNYFDNNNFFDDHKKEAVAGEW